MTDKQSDAEAIVALNAFMPLWRGHMGKPMCESIAMMRRALNAASAFRHAQFATSALADDARKIVKALVISQIAYRTRIAYRTHQEDEIIKSALALAESLPGKIEDMQAALDGQAMVLANQRDALNRAKDAERDAKAELAIVMKEQDDAYVRGVEDAAKVAKNTRAGYIPSEFTIYQSFNAAIKHVSTNIRALILKQPATKDTRDKESDDAIDHEAIVALNAFMPLWRGHMGKPMCESIAMMRRALNAASSFRCAQSASIESQLARVTAERGEWRTCAEEKIALLQREVDAHRKRIETSNIFEGMWHSAEKETIDLESQLPARDAEITRLREVLTDFRKRAERERQKAGEQWGWSCMGVFYAENDIKRIDVALAAPVAEKEEE